MQPRLFVRLARNYEAHSLLCFLREQPAKMLINAPDGSDRVATDLNIVQVANADAEGNSGDTRMPAANPEERTRLDTMGHNTSYQTDRSEMWASSGRHILAGVPHPRRARGGMWVPAN